MNNKEFYKLLVECGGQILRYSGRDMFGNQCIRYENQRTEKPLRVQTLFGGG